MARFCRKASPVASSPIRVQSSTLPPRRAIVAAAAVAMPDAAWTACSAMTLVPWRGISSIWKIVSQNAQPRQMIGRSVMGSGGDGGEQPIVGKRVGADRLQLGSVDGVHQLGILA